MRSELTHCTEAVFDEAGLLRLGLTTDPTRTLFIVIEGKTRPGLFGGRKLKLLLIPFRTRPINHYNKRLISWAADDGSKKVLGSNVHMYLQAESWRFLDQDNWCGRNAYAWAWRFCDGVTAHKLLKKYPGSEMHDPQPGIKLF